MTAASERADEVSLVLAARTLATSALSKNVAVLPQFLVGGLAVLMQDDMQLTATQLGALVSAFFAASAMASAPGGRLGDRIGAYPAMGLAALGSAAALLGIGVLARNWVHVLAFMVLAGIANGVAQPATNLALSRGIPRRWQGFAFGIKQAANPLATLLAGLAVPLIGLTVGWRWAFTGGAAVAVAVILIATASTSPSAVRRVGESGVAGMTAPRMRQRRYLVVFAAAAAFGTAAASAMAAFYVPTAVAHGHSAAAAGSWLAVGGLLGIVARMFWGWMADRRTGGHFTRVSALMLTGAFGFLLLGTAGSTLTLAVGTALAFGAGWAWPGLFVFAVVLENRDAPAAATGITQTGTFIGGMVGPLTFGAVLERTTYLTAWGAIGASVLIAGVLVLIGQRVLARHGVADVTGASR